MKTLREFGFETDNGVYVVAEIGINHGGSITKAKEIIESAARTGVDAVKFQTYITEKRTTKGSPIFDILKECELPFYAFKQLKEFSEEREMHFFSTPFDEESVDLLCEIGVSLIKVASFDLANQKLLEKIASTKKTILVSVGMANLTEIKGAYRILRSKTEKMAILHCVSAYPTAESDAKLAVLQTLISEFPCIIGQSDHTDDIRVPLYAVAGGAQIIEKHYKIGKEMKCVDSSVSITEEQMTEMVEEIRRLEKIIGESEFGVRSSEKNLEPYRNITTLR